MKGCNRRLMVDRSLWVGWLALMWLAASPLLADQGELEPDSPEAPYWVAAESRWSIGSRFVYQDYRLDFAADDDLPSLAYQPNSPWGLELSLGYNGYNLSWIVYEHADRDKADYVSTTRRDIQFRSYKNHWGYELYYQDYRGFYGESEDLIIQRDDIRSRKIGASGFYLFNAEHYSLQAAFEVNERQLRSAGSWLLFAHAAQYQLSAEHPFIPPELQKMDNAFVELNGLNHFSSEHLSLGAGYSHTWVREGWFLNTTLMGGPALQRQRFEWHKDQRDTWELGYDVGFKLGVGWQQEQLRAALTMHLHQSTFRLPKGELNIQSGAIALELGYLF